MWGDTRRPWLFRGSIKFVLIKLGVLCAVLTLLSARWGLPEDVVVGFFFSAVLLFGVPIAWMAAYSFFKGGRRAKRAR